MLKGYIVRQTWLGSDFPQLISNMPNQLAIANSLAYFGQASVAKKMFVAPILGKILTWTWCS